MKNKVHTKSLSLLFLFALSLVIKPPVVQGCNQIRCGHKNTIVVTSGMVVGGIRSGCGHDTIIVEPGAQVVSEGPDAIGIDSGNGHDSVINGGTITVIATAVQDAGEKWYGSGYGCGSSWKKTIPDASATAIGIETGNGHDSVLNTGTISVTASSLLTDSGTARSLAIGIDSGNGKDSSENVDSAIVSEAPPEGATDTALIEVTATSSASLSGNSWEFTGKHKVDLSVTTEAIAAGIVGGNGKDSIVNASTLNVSAVSDITAEGISATMFGVGGVNMSIHGDAFAVGIDGGNGKDEIINQGDITVSATSYIETESIAASVLGAAQVNDSDFDGSTTATATAMGIYTGMAKDEVLGITNSSTIDVQAEASVDAESYALTFAGDAITDLSLAATAVASGIGSGCGKDTIANAGTLTVGASSSVDSVSLDLNFLDIFKSKADLDAEAEAVGIDSGAGKDSVLNTGTLTVSAVASTEAWTAEFNAIDVAIGDFSSSSSAAAVGIAGGQGKDTITNTGTITADAGADALVGNFTLTMIDFTAISDILDTVGNASTTVDAEAVGISSGSQDDTIISSGDITATATTEATTIAVGVGAEGIPAGVLQGDILRFENLASAGVFVNSRATGIDSGTGDDEITNQGNITADASATSWGGSVSLSLPLLEKWVPIPSPAFAMISAGTEVGSEATGIQAGEGDDLILNEGDLDIDAASSALNVTASMAFQGFVSDINIIDIAAARADAFTKAEATASGIEGGEGDDQIFNSGNITVDATSETLSVAAAIAIQKSVKEAVNLEGTMADVSATATAEATGISGGSGHDTITSTGNTTVAAESNNAGVGLSAAITCESEKGLVANAAVAKADTTSTAKATGIDGGDGEDTIFNSGAVDVTAHASALSAEVGLTLQGSNTKVISLQGALTTVTTTAEATANGLSGGSGNDLIINEGDLTVEADSLGIAAAIAANITPKKTKGIGIALANAQNTATSTATGISGGEGDDVISNSGDVTVDAGSTAVAASVTVTRVGFTGSGTLDPVSFDSGNNAEAIATGIDGGEGNETITNSGALDVSSTVVTASASIAGSSKGISAAISTATATATATGIDTGEGTHWIHNTGTISADAEATAVGVSVAIEGKGIAAGIDTFWDGGTTATATAMGIHAENGDDLIINEGAIDATSSATAPSVDVAITGKGVSVGISTATSEALSVGIDSGEGDDQIYNSGAISASASAEAYAIAVDISGKGVAVSANDVWDGGVEAHATAKGIDAGAGSNTIINEGDIIADSSATTVSAAVSIVGKGLSASVSTATATAESVGIDPGDTTENVFNSGDITAEATATAVTANVDITGKGAAAAVDAVWDGGTTATATARGIDAGHVDNTIWNEGTIAVDTEATAPSVAVAIAGKGLTAAVTTSTAIADSIGIDTQEGDDIVHNSGAIEANATAEAYAIEVSVAGKGVAVAADTVWDGGTKATATATGIDTGNGNDTIFNTANIQADSSATTVSVGVSVAGEGISAAVSTSTAEATASGIAAGTGADTIKSTGDITADAESTAVTVNVDVTGKGIAVATDAVWDGGTKSTAVAKGIDAGSGNEKDTIFSTGNITATSEATTVSVSASIAAKGITVAAATATTTATAVGIDSGAGSDLIQSEGNITADASATGVAVAASITAKGIAAAFDEVWDGGTDTTTIAKGIDAGDGDDCIISSGDITATSDATTVAVDAAITAKGISAASSTATTTATAVGIDSGTGSDVIQSEGAITADASATGVAVAASITAKGIAAAFDEVWDGGTDTTTTAKGIDAADGDDSISSSGDITATSDATTVAVDVAITAMGISAAASTATTTASAVGIDSGAGNDTIQSEGVIVADASATGVAVAASITAKGIAVATDAVWDGGTNTTTIAKGIDAGDGDDSIVSSGDITATSDATTVAVDVAITAMGISAASSTATTTATAVGIDSGAGNDTIQSEGAIVADASATGVAVAASITAKGIAAATDAVWDGGTHTTTVAMGINAADGDDSILSIGDITATSDATTVAVDAAITAMGISAAASTATTTATAVGIDSGVGNDNIQSEGAIVADASATGVAVAASITAMGVAGATDAVWDGGTDTTATAIGIDTGDGNDLIENNEAITATADATTVAVDVAIAAKGIAVAATASATTANTVGIDSGAGNDTILNTGNITADSSAFGVGVAAGITGLGISGATDAVWDSGTTATSVATGIEAGAGDDTINNTGAINVTSEAETIAVDVAFTVAGLTGAMTNTTVEAQAVGIDGGEGADSIYNEGIIQGSASSTAMGIAVSLSGAGISVSATDLWENGVSGEALFTGIDAGSGNDTIVNSGAIIGNSETTTPAVSVTLTLAGIGAAANTATADARSIGIDGGTGNDTIVNTGNITAAALADANTVIVSIAGVGIAAGADSFWDGGTTATAAATGIAGGEGNDLITNAGTVATSATADTASTGVTATLAGASASLVNSTAKAQATGIDGGEGNDTISNTGAIAASAQADADTVAVSVSGIGASFAGDQWSENTLASATAIGIEGGSGNDTIQNTATITASAVSNSDATAVTVSLVGYADSEAENTSETLAVGISGGEGNDAIDNSGDIAVVSASTADAGNVTVNLAGAAPAEAGTTAMAVGVGIDGGAGDDTIRNEGNISIASAAATDASSVTVALIGYGDSEADNLSLATATGISGGDGDDDITNTGNITVASASTAEAGSVSIGLAGAVFGEAGTTASAVTVGIDGGAGSDVIENHGSVSATSTASTDSSSTGVILLGYGDSNAECASVAATTGISAGAGDDTIINHDRGSITLVSLATAKAGSVQVGLAGAVGGEAGTTATATATAIDGGLGSDTIQNAAQINVAAATSTSADNTTVGIFGSAESDVNTTAVTIAEGIDGGDGDDTIENTGNISVASSSAMVLDAYAFDFGGSSAGQGTLTAYSSSVGISGGSGSDTIDNEGQISVSAVATMNVTGGSDVAFGSASAGANTTAVTDVVGIDAGDGDDTITNKNTITVSALTTMALDSSSFSFGGTAASGEGAMSAATRAIGISGGKGSDSITSDALITVNPRTAMYALSGSDVAFGSADAGTTITASTEAAGIDGGSGNDTIVNRGGITVGYYNDNPADAMTKIDVSGSTWSFGGTGSVSAAALATGSSIGIDGGDGDDTILNEATIEVNSTTYARTYGSSYSFAGTSGSSGVVTATSTAVGIRGGAGNDTITNSAVMTVKARSYTTSTGSASTTFGSSEAFAGATSSASAVGIDGDAGDEVIENTGTISAGAYAHAYGSTDSDVFAGSPSATSQTTVTASALGISAGSGSNSIDNTGLISVAATALAAPDATADSDISDNDSGATSGMSASALGISALAGDDAIRNGEKGSIIAAATAVATPYAHSDENSSALAVVYAATAKGIDAGDGHNVISNLGNIQANAQATILATAVSRSLVYTAHSNALATAAVEAAGITTGRGNDVIFNDESAVIAVRATAIATALGIPRPGEGAHTDQGNANVGLTSFPLTAHASGIAAGDGDNTIDNLGVIDAEAKAQATAWGEADTTTWRNTATANVVASAVASGISSGNGTDTVLNDSGASIRANAKTGAIAVADPDEHGYINTPGVSAASGAYGIKLGNGNKNVVNRGSVSAIAESTSQTDSTAHSNLWDTDSRIVVAVSASAQGIATGSGDSCITNSGDIDSLAIAYSTANSQSDSIDDAWSQVNTVVLAEAQGIEAGGGGAVYVENSGSIEVNATAVAYAVGRADSGGDGYGEVYMTMDPTAGAAGIIVGDATSCSIHNGEGSTIRVASTLSANLSLNGDEYAVVGRWWDHGVEAEATAHGIAAGNGEVEISNDGTIEVNLDSRVDARTHSRSTTRSTHTYAWITSNATAVGIQAGNGGHSIDNTGTITVTAANTADGNRGGPASDSYYNADAEVGAYAYTNAFGIALGSGDAELSNSGTIDVVATSNTYGYTRGDSGAGDGNATTHALTDTNAAGISIGSGGSLVSVENSGGITVNSNANTSMAYAHGDDDSYAYGTSTGRAAGIELGDNTTMAVDNSGTIVATTSAHSHAADDEPVVSSRAYTSSFGIKAGNGKSTLTNTGTITANSSSVATWWSDEGPNLYIESKAEATGIRVGTGTNEIVNDGTIEATAYAGSNYGLAIAEAYGIHAAGGNNTIINNGTITSTAIAASFPIARAYGIKTGSGDDLIINNGTITTEVVLNGVSDKGIGIDTGTGNDQVILGDGSYIGCELDLGEGNDGLTVIGSGSISGNVYGGDGTDALTLDGATNFNLDKTFSFESLAKLGSSTVSLNNAQMLEQLDVFEGLLQINNNYQFTDTGSFSTKVYGGGACGQLLVKGNLGLDGTMTVVRGPGAYLDGTTYEVITADTLSGAFDDILLPNTTALLSFDLADTGNNSYLVTASTEHFSTVATNRIEQAVTEHLDAIIASAKGDLSLVLGEIQGMPASAYGTALSSLSPDSYDCSTKTTFSAVDQFTQVLSNRLNSLRTSFAGRTADSGVRPLIDRTAFGSSSRQNTSSEQMESYGLWLSGFGQWGGFDPSDGFTGFDFNLYGTTLGYDHYLGRNLTAGASLGYSNTEVYFDDNRGAGLIDTVTGSVYGSYATERLFLDTALSYGRQSYENYRNVEVGTIQRTAESDHGGNACSAYLGGGLSFGSRPWTVQPLASLQYMYLDEEAFTEEGAGSVSLSVHERATSSLVSDLGLRLGLSFNTGRGDLVSELYAAWRHDFAVDKGTITASFVDTPDAPFTISGPEAQQNGVLLGASLVLKDSDRFSAALRYNVELRGQYNANSLIGEIHYGF